MRLSEIVLILLIMLIVIKPEDLPKIAKNLGRCMQWMQNQTKKLKQELFHESRD